jgi:uncharacterized protein (TIGR02118 family)
MIKIIALVQRNDDLSFEEFVAYWQNHHAKLVAQLPGLRRYVQNPALDLDLGRDRPYDGCAELWYDDLDALRTASKSPESERVREDEPRFVKSIDWFLATEHAIIP